MPDALCPADLVISRVILDADTVILDASGAAETARCPACGAISGHVHACYQRRPIDLPWRGARVRLVVTVRRFLCENRACARVTFAEDFGAELPRGTRRTAAVTAYLTLLVRAAGGEAGARLAREAGVPTSPDTLLRLQRSEATAAEPGTTPRVLGVDDFALRRGRTYGTLLMDMETHRPVDLLPERDAGVLAAWLREHPGVEVIVRDRAGAYADGANRGAPGARQVADRFHIVRNGGDALKELLRGRPMTAVDTPAPDGEPLAAGLAPLPADPPGPDVTPDPPSAASPPVPAPAAPAPDVPAPPPSAAQVRAADRRTAHVQRWERAHALVAAGRSIVGIAKDLGISRWLVRKLIATTQPPDPHPPAAPTGHVFSSAVRPFLPYLQERWAAGHTNVAGLYRELIGRGYAGSRPTLQRALASWTRPTGPAPQPRAAAGAPTVLSRRDRRWLCLRPRHALSPQEQATLEQVLALDPDLATGYDLTRRLRTVMATGDVVGLDTWLADAHASGLAPFVSLARGLEADRDAVDAALTTSWSQGPTEGHVCRVKLIKRQGYGRAKLDLLKARVLATS